MAQVVATRLIHGSFVANPGSGSQQSFSEKLKPGYGFAAKVLAQNEKRTFPGAVHVSAPIMARSTRVDSEVIPVTPEDVPKVHLLFYIFGIFMQFGDVCLIVTSLF